MNDTTAKLLRRYAAKYETVDFFICDRDPSTFLHDGECSGGDAGLEAAAFVASTLSFGSVKQFVPKIRTLVNFAHGDMDSWIRSGTYNHDLKTSDDTFYRFVTFAELRAFLDAYRRIMRDHNTLGAYVRERAGGTGIGAVQAICDAFSGSGAGHLVPACATSACKRICMFLRWMVRTDSPVDIGLWSDFIDRRTLIVPMDTHVVQEAASLGLLTGRCVSMAAARKLSSAMLEIFPDDPLKGDFALYGHNLEASSRSAP